MPTEQPAADSAQPSIEERLSAVLGAQEAPEDADEATQAEEADAEAPEVQEAETDSPEEEAPAEETELELADWQDDDGKTYRVPVKVKEAALRQADYTQKTQQVARLAEAAEDRLKFAEAREQIGASLMQQIGNLQAMKLQLEQYKTLDWSAIYQADPGNGMRLRDQRDQLERQVGDAEKQITAQAAHIQRAAQDHQAKQWGLAVEGAKARIGKVTADEDAAMLKAVKDLGFTDKEMRERFADARFLHAIWKAAKFDLLQASKPGALKAVQKAPPVLKPGAANGPNALQRERYKQGREQLKRTGSLQDAARLLSKY